jgi:undecaprenyl pyrophosphate phosphatase UppP
VQFFVSLAWSLPWLGGVWLLERSITMVAILAVVFLYWSAIGVAIEFWRGSHPDAPKERAQRLRLLAILPVLVGIPVALYFFG